MKKVLAALFTALALGVSAYFSPEAAWNVMLGLGNILAAIVISWAATSLFPLWHEATAKVSALIASLALAYAAWGWGEPLLFWLMPALIPAALSPLLYERLFRTDNAARALLSVVASKCGVQLRWKGGELDAVKVGTDETIFLGGGEPEDVERNKVKPEPENN